MSKYDVRSLLISNDEFSITMTGVIIASISKEKEINLNNNYASDMISVFGRYNGTKEAITQKYGEETFEYFRAYSAYYGG